MPQSPSAVYVHLTFSTQDELTELLHKHHIEFDELFVWD